MRFALLAALVLLLPEPTAAREVLPGPMPGEVTGVVDGDTVAVRVRIWLGQDVETRVRLRGIDAPELRARCDEERVQAEAARDALAALLTDDPHVVLREVEQDAFGGRVVARLDRADGEDLAARLIEEGLARAYDGRAARDGWCG